MKAHTNPTVGLVRAGMVDYAGMLLAAEKTAKLLAASAEDAARALEAFGASLGKLKEAEFAVLQGAAKAKRPWYQRGRW